MGTVAVLEQKACPLNRASVPFSGAKRNDSQTQNDTLAVFCAVLQLAKYLFGLKFTTTIDHQTI